MPETPTQNLETPQDPFSKFSPEDKVSIARQLIQLRNSGKLNPKQMSGVEKTQNILKPSLQAESQKQRVEGEKKPKGGMLREAELGFASQFGLAEKGAGYASLEPLKGAVKGVGELFKNPPAYDPTGGALSAAYRLGKGFVQSVPDIYREAAEAFKQEDFDKLGHAGGRAIAFALQVATLKPGTRAGLAKAESATIGRIAEASTEHIDNIGPKLVERHLKMPQIEAHEFGKQPGRALVKEVSTSLTAKSLLENLDAKVNEVRPLAKAVVESATRRGVTVDLTVPVESAESTAKWQRPSALGPSRQLPGQVDPTAPALSGIRPGAGRVSDVFEQSFSDEMSKIYHAKGAAAFEDPVFTRLQKLHEQFTAGRDMSRLSPVQIDAMLSVMDREIQWAKQNKLPWQSQLAKARHEVSQRFHVAVPDVVPLDKTTSNLLTARPYVEKFANNAGIVSTIKGMWASPSIAGEVFTGATAYALYNLGFRGFYEIMPGLLAMRMMWYSTPSVLARAQIWNFLGDVLDRKIDINTAVAKSSQAAQQAKAGTGGIGRPPAPSGPGQGPRLPSGPAAGPTGGGPGSIAPPPPLSGSQAAPPQIGGAQMGVPTGGTPPVSPTRPGVVAPELPPYRIRGVEVKTASEGASGIQESQPKTGAERQAKYRSSEKGRVKEPVKGEAAEIAIQKEARASGASAQEKLEAMDVGLTALEQKFGPRGKQIADAIRLLYKGKRLQLDEVLDAVENANQKLAQQGPR